jgi:hypothetical protein
MTKKKSAAELYRSRKVERPVVEVVPPSGFVFKFHKPSPLKFVLTNGLPTSLAGEMTTKGKAKKSTEKVAEDDLIDTLMRLRDLVIDLSVEPKLTLSENPVDGELSVDEVEDEDLSYLLNWVASGGAGGENLATFRDRPAPDAVAESYRQELREATERTPRDRK